MILRIYHNAVKSGDLKVGQSAKLSELLEKVNYSSIGYLRSGKVADV